MEKAEKIEKIGKIEKIENSKKQIYSNLRLIFCMSVSLWLMLFLVLGLVC